MTSIQTIQTAGASISQTGCNPLSFLEQFEMRANARTLSAAQFLLWHNLTPYAVAMQTGLSEADIMASPECQTIIATVIKARKILWNGFRLPSHTLSAQLTETGMPAEFVAEFVEMRHFFECAWPDIPLYDMPFVANAPSPMVSA